MAITMGLSPAGCALGLSLLAFLYTDSTTAVRLNRLTVPDLQDYRDHATLVCDYELITNKLNSVKWYKDGSEFFRYAPMQQSGYSLFKVTGVHVHNNSIDCDTRTCRIQLWYLTPQSSGLYRCEVSGDAPDFKLVYRMANMTVGALPQYDPIISGLVPMYAFGEYLHAECMAAKSSPPATISWTINDVPIPQAQQQPLRTSDADFTTFSQQNRSLDLQYAIEQIEWGHVRQLTVRCTASLYGFPNHRRHSEQVIEVGVPNTLSNERLVNPKGSAAAGRNRCGWSLAISICTTMLVAVRTRRSWC